jgi:hypothetical protein
MIEFRLLYTNIRNHEVCLHKQLWNHPEVKNSKVVFSKVRISMVIQILRLVKQFLQLFDRIEMADYSKLSGAYWTQLSYVLITLRRIIFLNHESDDHKSDEVYTWDPTLVATEADIGQFGNSMRMKLSKFTLNTQNGDGQQRNVMYNFGLLSLALIRLIFNSEQVLGTNDTPLVNDSSAQSFGIPCSKSQEPGITPRNITTSVSNLTSNDAVNSVYQPPWLDFSQMADWPHDNQQDSSWNAMMQELSLMPMPWSMQDI